MSNSKVNYCPQEIRSTPYAFREGDYGGFSTYLQKLADSIILMRNKKIPIDIYVSKFGNQGGYIKFYNIENTEIFKSLEICTSADRKLFYPALDSVHQLFNKVYNFNTNTNMSKTSDLIKDLLIRNALKYTDVEIIREGSDMNAQIYIPPMLVTSLESILDRSYIYKFKEQEGYTFYYILRKK